MEVYSLCLPAATVRIGGRKLTKFQNPDSRSTSQQTEDGDVNRNEEVEMIDSNTSNKKLIQNKNP